MPTRTSSRYSKLAERDNERLGANARAKAEALIADTRTEAADLIAQLNERRRKVAEDVGQLLSHRRVVLDSIDRLRQHTTEAAVDIDDDDSTSALSGNRR